MDSGFHHDQIMSYAPNRHAILFQSSAVDSTNEMIMMRDYYGLNSKAGMMFSGNSGMVNSSSGYVQIGNSGSSIISDMVPGLKHNAGLAVEWSSEEQNKLDEGISKYADEPSIMRYVKIAATLRDKTVRDVALRCRWIALLLPFQNKCNKTCSFEESKRRKQDELKPGRKFKDKKEKIVESMSKPCVSSISSLNVAPFSVTMNNRLQSNGTPLEALSVSTRHLLKQNNQVFGQISANISALKLQDNFDLFNHAKNNLTAILNDMRYTPGPPLPVSLNEDLANTILPTTSQTLTFGSTSRLPLKQELDY